MGFASAYLNERTIFPELIKEAPDRDTGIIAVVPAYDEPEILKMLDSLILCDQPPCKAEVIIVVNAPSHATVQSIRNNEQTIEEIENWKSEGGKRFFRVYCVKAVPVTVRKWGVGLARKTGMDEALRRFDRLDRPEGVILNLDADCTVEKNYFVSVFNDMFNKRGRSACSVYFEHPLEGNAYSEAVYRNITLYELHLRYYFQALSYTGFPSVFHTIGSATAVKALPYVKAGGMNRRQAGEDFYFIQKLIPAGGYFSLNSTTVYPSPRPSFRVPFGTGASISRLTGSEEEMLLTYDFSAFRELRSFFAMAAAYYHGPQHEQKGFYESLPPGVCSYLGERELLEKLSEIRNNTSGSASFKKRFFVWFNMFRVVKYLNCVHAGMFEKKPVALAAHEYLKEDGIILNTDDTRELLYFYRKLEKPDQ